jgi:carbamoyltransferase
MTNYIGISEGFHDAGLALVNSNGNILFAGHAERYSKVKNDSLLNDKIVQDCLSYATSNELVSTFYEKPWLKQLRRWYSGNFKPVQTTYKKRFDKVSFVSHHQSHAAAAFQTSPFGNAAVVVIDAIGEWDTISIWRGTYNKEGIAQYKKLWSRKYPHSIGLFYSAMTQRAGLKPNEDEYILMGMSAYGKRGSAVSTAMLQEFVYDLDNLYFKRNLHLGCLDFLPKLPPEDIAAGAQCLIEEMVLQVHKIARSLTGSSQVCYGGGVALNCVANSMIANLWDSIWIPPNPGDSGSALGAAALAYGKQLRFVSPYLGTTIVGGYPVTAARNALLKDGMVGVANGRAEYGPRAFGNRSLFADPRISDIKDRLNVIKQRQAFRPFAPVVLQEHADNWFERVAPGFDAYMQYAVKTKQYLPGTTHIDGTSRVQVVGDDGSGIRKLLESWYASTGCPVLVNTSLNIKSMPIVNDKQDALAFETKYNVRCLTEEN